MDIIQLVFLLFHRMFRSQRNIIRGNINARNSWFSAIIRWVNWYYLVLDTLINIKVWSHEDSNASRMQFMKTEYSESITAL
jgi:hypothetical protein